MQIYPINSTGTTSGQDTASTATSGMKTLGQDDFLKLLAAQMQAQDPMDPMKDTEFVAQMASFTSLQQMKDLTTSFDTFATQQKAVDAQNYLGKSVSLTDPVLGTTVSGTVSGVTFASGTPQIIVNGSAYDPATVTGIQAPTTTNP